MKSQQNQSSPNSQDKMDPSDSPQKALTSQRYKSFFLFVVITLNACLGSFYFGYSIAYLGTIDFPDVMKIFDIQISQSSANGLFIGSIPIGAGIGAFLSSYLIKFFSPRNRFLVINGIAAVFGVLTFIPNTSSLLIGRLVQGMCVGLYSSVTPLYVKQLSPNQISGSLGALNQLLIAFGVFFVFLYSLALKLIFDDQPQKYWYLVFGFTYITIAVQTIVLIFIFPYETPKYYLQHGEEAKAKELLSQLYTQQSLEEVFEEKILDVKGVQQSPYKILSMVSQDNVNKSPPNNIPNIVAFHISLLQQMVGINAVVAYGPPIASAVLPGLKNVIPVILDFLQVASCFLTSYLLTRFGRKYILQLGTMAAFISLCMITVGFFIKSPEGAKDVEYNFVQVLGIVLILFGLFIFMLAFGLSIGPIVWLYIPEIVQPRIISYATACNWAGASIVMILFPIIKQAMPNKNPAPLFLFFCIYTGLSFLVNQKLMIETKGKTEKQIKQQYSKMKLL